MATFIKVLNISLIIALTFFVGFASAIFFIGSNETYSMLLETLPASFARRAMGGICVGIIGAALILFINYLILKVTNLKTTSFRKLFWSTVAATSIAAVVGTIIFFCQ